MNQKMYDEARTQKYRYEEYRDETWISMKNVQSNLSVFKSKRKNLEERLEDIKNVIKKLDELDNDQVINAVITAREGDEKYQKGIICDFCIASSLETNHSTQGIKINLYSNNAYENCVDEKKRVEQEIIDIETKIKALERMMLELKDKSSSYNNKISHYESIMWRAVRG